MPKLETPAISCRVLMCLTSHVFQATILCSLLFQAPTALSQVAPKTGDQSQLTGSLTGFQAGSGSSLDPILSLKRLEGVVPSRGESPLGQFDYTLNWGDGVFNGYNNLLINTRVFGDQMGNGPKGNVYPVVSNLYEKSLRSLLSPPDGSQDTNFYSFVEKNLPQGGVPPGRSMRDSWNWWAQVAGANLPSSKEGASIMWEHDILLNGLDDANRRYEEQTTFKLKTSLASGGYPASMNVGRYLSGGDPDFWAHDWFDIGGNFSHAGIDMFYARAAYSTIVSATARTAVYSVQVDNIMPLEGGGASGGVDFPPSSTSLLFAVQSGSPSRNSIEVSDASYILPQMFLYDDTDRERIPDGTRVTQIDGRRLVLSRAISSRDGDRLLFALARKAIVINQHSYLVIGISLDGPGKHGGQVYFASPIPPSDTAHGIRIYPNAHAIWLCSGSTEQPWCDVAFDASGRTNIRADGSEGLLVGGPGLTADKLQARGEIVHASYLYDLLPSVGGAGREVFCRDCLKPGERPGRGTGMLVFDDGHGRWVSTAGTVAAH